MGSTIGTTAAKQFDTDVSASGSAANINLSAAEGKTRVIHEVSFSYDVAPGADDKFRISIGGTILFTLFYNQSGTFVHKFPEGFYGSPNEAIAINLQGETGSIATINCVSSLV